MSAEWKWYNDRAGCTERADQKHVFRYLKVVFRIKPRRACYLNARGCLNSYTLIFAIDISSIRRTVGLIFNEYIN